MAITDKKTGVWGLDQVYNKENQGSIWTYSGAAGEPGELWVWGRSADYGQLGANTFTYYSSPIQIPGNNWETGSRNTEASAATKSDGTYWIWGVNIFGSLGLNETNNTNHRSSPVQLPGTTWARGGVLAYRSAYGIKTDGTLWVWGDNDKGKLGQNNGSPSSQFSSPVQIPGTTWSAAGPIGMLHAMWSVKTDGTLWTWGQNDNGQLGDNSTTYRSSPTQIPGTTWTEQTTGGDKFCVTVKTDGTLWGWGENSGGYLGQNNKTQYSSPKQIPGTTWNKVASGAYNVVASKTDGTLWTWGSNSHGQLGQTNRNPHSSPIQIPGTTWVEPFPIGHLAVGSTKTDGTLWVWGQNGSGQLGQNNQTQYSSPVQVPGTTWDVTNMTRYGVVNSQLGGFFKRL